MGSPYGLHGSPYIFHIYLIKCGWFGWVIVGDRNGEARVTVGDRNSEAIPASSDPGFTAPVASSDPGFTVGDRSSAGDWSLLATEQLVKPGSLMATGPVEPGSPMWRLTL